METQTLTATSPFFAPSEIKELDIINLRELAARAKEVLHPGPYGYIASASGDEWTMHENEAAFKRVTIVPRLLNGEQGADVRTTLLGSQLSMPIIVSPMGSHGLAHETAEVGTAMGAAAAGTIVTATARSTSTCEEIAAAAPDLKWFQIYMMTDRGRVRDILLRAKAAGYTAIVLTIDSTGSGNRETDKRNGWKSPVPLGNYPGERAGDVQGAPVDTYKRDLGWDDVEFIQKTTGLPVVLKGVMYAELAQQALENGCGAVQVSNHGGRNLDDMPASLTVLPEIADAVGGRLPIILDGGVRRGQDVFKAIGLGANAVALGRPVMYGLALGGWMGVRTVLNHLKGELEMTMRLTGAHTLPEITKRYLHGY
jgi:lactate oxidase